MAYAGYYIKIGSNTFNNPLPSSEGYKIKEDIETDMDSAVNAAGNLIRNILPTKRHELNITFPPMTQTQWRTYIGLLDHDAIVVEFYSYKSDTYRTGTFYMPTTEHNTLFKQGSAERIMPSLEVNLISYGSAT